MPDRCRCEILILLSVTSGVIAVAPQRIRAADWSLAPTLTLGVDYDTNRSLLIEPRSSAGAEGNLQLFMGRSLENLSLSLTPAVGFQWFSDPTLQRANSFALTAVANWSGERSSLSMKTNVNDQNLLYVELFDTGIVDQGTRRLLGETDIGWTFAQTERLSLSASGAFQDITFHGGIEPALEDSRYATFGLNEGAALTERFEFDVGATVGRFTSPAQAAVTDSYDVNVGFKYKPSARLSASGDLGVNELSYGASATRGLTFDLSLSYATEVGTLALTGSRGASPSGFGELTERDALQVSYARSLSDRLTITPALDFFRTSVAIGPFPLDLRTYADASLTLAWRASAAWTLSTHVSADGARTEGLVDLLGVVGTAHGWNAGVQAAWAPTRRSISR
jgi:hypothetical protein